MFYYIRKFFAYLNPARFFYLLTNDYDMEALFAKL